MAKAKVADKAPPVQVRTPPIVLADVEVKGRECYATCRECGAKVMAEQIGNATKTRTKKEALEHLTFTCPRGVRHETREALIAPTVKLWTEGFGGMKVPVKLFGKEAATMVSAILKKDQQQASVKAIVIMVYGENKDDTERAAMILQDLDYHAAIDPTCPWRKSRG